jgi:hypothetical protein
VNWGKTAHLHNNDERVIDFGPGYRIYFGKDGDRVWEFLERQVFKRGPVEIYGEMELLRLLDRFLDRALCFATEGFDQYSQ